MALMKKVAQQVSKAAKSMPMPVPTGRSKALVAQTGGMGKKGSGMSMADMALKRKPVVKK